MSWILYVLFCEVLCQCLLLSRVTDCWVFRFPSRSVPDIKQVPVRLRQSDHIVTVIIVYSDSDYIGSCGIARPRNSNSVQLKISRVWLNWLKCTLFTDIDIEGACGIAWKVPSISIKPALKALVKDSKGMLQFEAKTPAIDMAIADCDDFIQAAVVAGHIWNIGSPVSHQGPGLWYYSGPNSSSRESWFKILIQNMTGMNQISNRNRNPNPKSCGSGRGR